MGATSAEKHGDILMGVHNDAFGGQMKRVIYYETKDGFSLKSTVRFPRRIRNE